MNSNTYTISDIHGCAITLNELLEKIGVTKEDKLYFLGDYIDRGPDSKGVIDCLMKLDQDGYQVNTLCGNHEQMMFDEILNPNRDWFGTPPETLQSFGINIVKEIDIKYTNWLKGLAPYLEIDNYILVHGGLNFTNGNPLKNEDALLWAKDWYDDINYDWLGNRIIIHGHKPVSKEAILKMVKEFPEQHYINIDNGCVFNKPGYGHLACLNLSKMEIVFQKNLDGYYKN